MTAQLSDIIHDPELSRTMHDVAMVFTGVLVNYVGITLAAVATVAWERYCKWDRERQSERGNLRRGLHRI